MPWSICRSSAESLRRARRPAGRRRPRYRGWPRRRAPCPVRAGPGTTRRAEDRRDHAAGRAAVSPTTPCSSPGRPAARRRPRRRAPRPRARPPTRIAVSSSDEALTAAKYSVSWCVDQWKPITGSVRRCERDDGQVVHPPGALGPGDLAVGVEAARTGTPPATSAIAAISRRRPASPSMILRAPQSKTMTPDGFGAAAGPSTACGARGRRGVDQRLVVGAPSARPARPAGRRPGTAASRRPGRRRGRPGCPRRCVGTCPSGLPKARVRKALGSSSRLRSSPIHSR